MPILLPGLSVNQAVTRANDAVSSDKINNIIICCTRSVSGTASDNTPVEIESTSDLSTKIGTVPNSVLGSYEIIQTIARNARVYLYPCNTTGTPTDNQKLTAGIALLSTFTELDLSVVICPEAAMLANQADRTSVFTALNSFVSDKNWNWLCFYNTGSVTDTKAKADTERALYVSNAGNTSLFHGIIKDSANRDIPLAVYAAAWLIANNQNSTGFYSPAQSAVPGTVDRKYLLTLSEADSVVRNKGNYNFLWWIDNKYVIYNDATLSAETEWNWINSRLALSVLQNWCMKVLAGYVNRPADPNPNTETGYGQLYRAIRGAINAVCQKAIVEGAIEAYEIEMPPITSGKLSLTLRVKPVKSLRIIELEIVSYS